MSSEVVETPVCNGTLVDQAFSGGRADCGACCILQPLRDKGAPSGGQEVLIDGTAGVIGAFAA